MRETRLNRGVAGISKTENEADISGSCGAVLVEGEGPIVRSSRLPLPRVRRQFHENPAPAGIPEGQYFSTLSEQLISEETIRGCSRSGETAKVMVVSLL